MAVFRRNSERHFVGGSQSCVKRPTLGSNGCRSPGLASDYDVKTLLGGRGGRRRLELADRRGRPLQLMRGLAMMLSPSAPHLPLLPVTASEHPPLIKLHVPTHLWPPSSSWVGALHLKTHRKSALTEHAQWLLYAHRDFTHHDREVCVCYMSGDVW